MSDDWMRQFLVVLLCVGVAVGGAASVVGADGLGVTAAVQSDDPLDEQRR